MQRNQVIAAFIAYAVVMVAIGVMLVTISTNSPDEVHNRDTSKQIHRYVWG